MSEYRSVCRRSGVRFYGECKDKRQRSHPLSLLTAFAASSPKGTPLRYAGNFTATTKAVPLKADFPRPGEDVAQRQKGECGIAAGDDGRGIRGAHSKSSHLQKSICRRK